MFELVVILYVLPGHGPSTGLDKVTRWSGNKYKAVMIEVQYDSLKKTPSHWDLWRTCLYDSSH